MQVGANALTAKVRFKYKSSTVLEKTGQNIYIYIRGTPIFANIQVSCNTGLLRNLKFGCHNSYRFDIILKF